MNADMFPGEARTEDPNRRYTTREFMAWIKAKAGVDEWDLDVAADAESHHAPRWFSLLPYEGSAGVDGLVQSWQPSDAWFESFYGRNRILLPGALPWRVFCNPPFDDLAPWVERAWATVAHSRFNFFEIRLAMVLPGNRHEQPFWQHLVEPYRFGVSRRAHHGYELEVFHPPGRQSYAKPGSNGQAVGSAEWPSALLVWRKAP